MITEHKDIFCYCKYLNFAVIKVSNDILTSSHQIVDQQFDESRKYENY